MCFILVFVWWTRLLFIEGRAEEEEGEVEEEEEEEEKKKSISDI